MHYSQFAADRIAAAQRVISVHLPSMSGELCSACGHPFPCALRRAADGTLDAYGRLPRRLPGATLRAVGVLRPDGVAWRVLDTDGQGDRPRRGWFDAVVNPAVGVVRMPDGRRSRFVPFQRPGS
jgi:hypothetical protein